MLDRFELAQTLATLPQDQLNLILGVADHIRNGLTVAPKAKFSAGINKPKGKAGRPKGSKNKPKDVVGGIIVPDSSLPPVPADYGTNPDTNS